MIKSPILLSAVVITTIIVGGAFFLSYEPELGNSQIITKEYMVGGERVIINEQSLGASLEASFKPSATLYKWGDETFIKVWLDEEGDDNAQEVDGKIVWNNTDGSKEVNLYPLPATDQMENGGFEYEVILKEKPKTNVISLKIETQGLDFHYQPALNQEQQDEKGLVCTETICKNKDGNIRVSRPENVVGSYEVYHSTQQGDYTALGGKNYKAGKAFHIYRPKMIDSVGTEVWGNLHIENGILTVTIPQNFLDNAIYPIKHATGLTFGNTSLGGSAYSITDYIAGYIGQPASSGTVSKITAGLFVGDDISSNKAKTALYLVSDNSRVDPQTEERTFTSVDVNGWEDFDFTGGPSVTSGVDYFVLAWGDNISGAQSISINGASSAGGGKYYSIAYGAWPATVSMSNSGNSRSIYATYSAAAAGEERYIRSIQIFE